MMTCYNNSYNPSGWNNNGQPQYVQSTDWGQQVVVDPTVDPTSPMSVQPYGRGTPLTPEMQPLPGNGWQTYPDQPQVMPGQVIDQPQVLPGQVIDQPQILPGQVYPVQQEPLPDTLTQHIYTAGYLRECIGQLARVEFLVGNNVTDRVGYIREVGASYLTLESVDFGSLIVCDLYSVKFVTLLRGQIEKEIATTFSNI